MIDKLIGGVGKAVTGLVGSVVGGGAGGAAGGVGAAGDGGSPQDLVNVLVPKPVAQLLESLTGAAGGDTSGGLSL